MHETSSHHGIDAAPLLALMTQQAEAERASTLAGAEAEAQRIAAKARDEGAATRERALRTAETELSVAAQRGRERAEAEAHMLVLTAKDTIASEILAAAQADLAKIASGPDFKSVLECLLAEVLEGAGDDVVVLVPPAQVDTVKAWLDANGRSGLAVQSTPALKDGVAIQDAAKSYRVTNTLSTRFERQESALRKLSLQRLFGGEN